MSVCFHITQAASQTGELPVATKSNLMMVTVPANKLFLTQKVLDFCGILPIYNVKAVDKHSLINGTSGESIQFFYLSFTSTSSWLFVILIYRHACFAREYTTLETHDKLHAETEVYFNIFPSEDIDDVISSFSRLFLQTVILPNINNNKKITSWIKDLNFILSC